MEPVQRGDAEVVLDFGGQPRLFRIRLGELESIQHDCEAGPGMIAQRLARGVLVMEQAGKASTLALIAAGLGEWNVRDVRQTIWHGLRGGGMATDEATGLVRRELDARGLIGLIEAIPIAFAAITASTLGPKDEPVGEFAAAASTGETPKSRRRRSRTAASASR